MPKIEYPPQLPVSIEVDRIKKTIAANPVTIIAGETGSGKTTQLPKICLELGYQRIAHTQPRRIAARSVASRIREELQSTDLAQADWVGYKVRFSDTVSANTRVKLMTDGMLLAEIRSSSILKEYDVIIIDEAHERSLNIDFLLGFLRRLLLKRNDLKVIITSATIDHQRFSEHFDNAPVLEITGRNFPVTLHYVDPTVQADLTIGERIKRVINTILVQEPTYSATDRPARDILAFFSGERDIRAVSQYLRQQMADKVDVLPLYARLGNAEQNRVFSPGSRRRIVLATNVAETSLTVPNIGYVIDTGLVRMSRYSARSKMQRLPIEPISQASANQRSGRCGRIGPGVCYRIYTEDDFLSRSEFTEPEIQRTHLASVILQLHTLKLGSFEAFPFIDRPDSRYVNDGYQLLEELGALQNRQYVTPMGRQLARIPLDPRLGRVVLEAVQRGCLREALIITSALSVQDPRDIPAGKSDAAVQIHQQWFDERSEFIAYLKLWETIEESYEERTRKAFSKWCKKQVLSELRIREWRDLHRQLKLSAQSLKLAFNDPVPVKNIDYASLHLSLLVGFLHNVAQRESPSANSATKKSPNDAEKAAQRAKMERHQYLGVRNRKLSIFPGSTLKKKCFPWIMSAEIIETQRVYAHRIAQIEPRWIEQLAAAWLKKSYSEPHWSKKRGQVIALEQATFYGLLVYAGRRVHYAPIDAVKTREIFIQEALVAQQLNEYRGRPLPFYQHNKKLRAEVEQLEDKRRRRNILVDDQNLYDFYSHRLPKNILQQSDLDNWVKREGDKILWMQRCDLMTDNADEITQEAYPKQISFEGQSFRLSYKFEPGDIADGVTLTVPMPLLPVLNPQRLEWLVPGLLSAKCEALLRALPKAKRKNFVPVPNYVRAFLQAHTRPEGSLLASLSKFLWSMTGVRIDENDWRMSALEPVHFFYCQVMNASGEVVQTGRNVSQLANALQADVRELVSNAVTSSDTMSRTIPGTMSDTMDAYAKDEPPIHYNWAFPDLSRQVQRTVVGQTVTLYPALQDEGQGVKLVMLPSSAEQTAVMPRGLQRLFVLAMQEKVKYVKKTYRKSLDQLALNLFVGQRREELFLDMVDAVVFRLFIEKQPLIFEKAVYQQRVSQLSPDFIERFQGLITVLMQIAGEVRSVKSGLKVAGKPAYLEALNDIKGQQARLFSNHFIRDTPYTWLTRYPAYLKAIVYRLERLSDQAGKDRQLMVQYQQLVDKSQKWIKKLPEQDDRRKEVIWWFEELRISLFAQSIGTAMPVSEKRIEKFLVH